MRVLGGGGVEGGGGGGGGGGGWGRRLGVFVGHRSPPRNPLVENRARSQLNTLQVRYKPPLHISQNVKEVLRKFTQGH
jgi:hypothetical protein